jgi:hypothetical protein
MLRRFSAAAVATSREDHYTCSCGEGFPGAAPSVRIEGELGAPRFRGRRATHESQPSPGLAAWVFPAAFDIGLRFRPLNFLDSVVRTSRRARIQLCGEARDRHIGHEPALATRTCSPAKLLGFPKFVGTLRCNDAMCLAQSGRAGRSGVASDKPTTPPGSYLYRPSAKRNALDSITSSARASSVGGTVRPSAFAVLRLMTSSYLVGFCTGRRSSSH